MNTDIIKQYLNCYCVGHFLTLLQDLEADAILRQLPVSGSWHTNSLQREKRQHLRHINISI